ncbi:MAG TPA: polymer-forming cytoskeletal protein [Coriobacteriia bacterium]
MSGKKTELVCAVALAVVLALVLPATAMALTLRQGGSIAVDKGETVSDDLYAFGNTITIDGTVEGDVVAFGQIVVIGGQVRGSVITAAQTVRIDGIVDGSVRAAGQTVDVGGQVGGDLLAAGNQVSVPGTVNRDLAAGAQAVGITGTVGRNVMTGSSSVSIDGNVGGNVVAQSTRVTVGNDGSVGGNLDYWSAEQAVVQGSVSGTTSRHEPPTKQQNSGGGASGVVGAVVVGVVAWIQSFVGVVLLGLVMVLVVRPPMHGGSQALLDRPWPSLGAGALVFFATPMAACFVFIIGLFIGAWWLAFVLFAVYWLLLLAGLIVGGLALGRAILRRASAAGEPALAWSLLLGLVLVWLVGAVPFLGALAGWVVMTMGTGALLLLWMGKGEKPAAAPAVDVPQPVIPPMQPPMA